MTREELQDLAERVAELDWLDSAMAAALQPDRTEPAPRGVSRGRAPHRPPANVESQES